MLAWRRRLAEGIRAGSPPARGRACPRDLAPGFGLTAAWRGTAVGVPWFHRAHRADLRAWEPEYGGGTGRARSLAAADVPPIARVEGGAGGAGTAD